MVIPFGFESDATTTVMFVAQDRVVMTFPRGQPDNTSYTNISPSKAVVLRPLGSGDRQGCAFLTEVSSRRHSQRFGGTKEESMYLLTTSKEVFRANFKVLRI
jgi:hypothetical protein